MRNTAKHLWERAKAHFGRLSIVARVTYGIFAFGSAAFAAVSWHGWPVAMALLSAWLAASGVSSWGYVLLAGLCAWALTAVALAARSRAEYYKAMTPQPPALPTEPVPQPRFEPSYTDDEIQSELLPMLANLEGILNRRCVPAIAAWEEIHDKYWSGLGFLELLRGDEASNVANALAQSLSLIQKGHKELTEAASGVYEHDVAPLVDMPGPRLKETIDYLGNLLGKVREFAKPTADQVDRIPVFREDAGRLKQLIADHGTWVDNARLLIGNRNFALRQILEKRAASG